MCLHVHTKAKRKLSMVRSFLTLRSYQINYSDEKFLTTPNWDPLAVLVKESIDFLVRIADFDQPAQGMPRLGG